ncbi:MAG: InlB B-repeat-containing protein, partial [Bacteroidales bacterium]|nr:InlB B-repeat-containing protein [Bacteroidales bacterium]
MSKTKKCLIAILVAVTALCMAIALGAGCKSSKGYEVKFVTGDHAAVSSVRVESGEVITLPTPEEEDGYVFKGWYLAEDYSGNQYSASASYTVTENTTFYGKYNILAPLNLNLDGGTLEGSSFSLEEGENVSSYMNELVPEKARHQFDYWADANGGPISSTLAMPAEGLTLTAVYKVEVSVEVWVWDANGSATHYPEYDMIDYASVGGTNVVLTFPTVPTGLTMSSNQGTDGTYILSKVDSDPDKNAVKIYYDAGTLTWSCNTNYPSGTGLSSTVCATGTVTFGEAVELPADLTCYGYLLLGWAFTPGAATPEYSVDVVTPNLMVWDEDEGAYLLSGEAVVPATYRPEESSSTLYAVWSKGYVDMFGSYDVVYDTENGDGTVYLCRGGVFWESETYSAASNSYTFRNSYSNESIYVVRLRSDGYFVFYDRSRALETRYLVEYAYSGNGNSMSFTISDTEYFYYTAYDTVEYIADGYSKGVAEYGYDAEGYVVLNFTSGEMSGKVMTVYLVQVTYSDGSTKDGYIVRNENEAGQKITFGGVGYSDGLGGFKGYMDEDSYYISLTGFNICTYYSGSTAYSYYYWLEGDVLTLFYSDYSYAGEYHYSSELKRWVYYYSALDKTFEIYGADGTTVIGSVTLDGMYDGTMTTTDKEGTTKTEEVIFYVSSYVIGSVVVMYSNPDAAGNYYQDSAEYLYTYSYENGGYTYFLQKLPDTYIESYYFDSSSASLSSYQVFVIEGSEVDSRKGTITLYLYGYSSYAGYYVYFSVWTGDYEIKTDDTYGFDYYVVTNIQVTDEASYYGITTYYGSMLYEDLIEMTEVAFVPTTFYVTGSNGLYTYLYDSNIWYYIVSLSDIGDGDTGEDGDNEYEESAAGGEPSGEPAAEKEELYTEYTGKFELTLPQKENDAGDPATLSGEVSLIVINDYLVYAVMKCDAEECSTSGSEETLSLSGYIYSATDYRDKDYEIFTVYTLYLTFTIGEGENATTYYWTPLVEFGTDDEGENVFAVVDEIPYYVFSYVMESDDQGTEAGRQGDEYFTYDLLAGSDEREVTYVKGESTYKGTISEYTDSQGNSSTPTGYTLYKFEGTSETEPTGTPVSIVFIVAGYGTSSEGYFPVFILYDENARVKYTGSDGSTFETDGVGLGATYTTGRTAYSVSSYVIVNSEELIGAYGGGAYNAGYIELYADGTYYILDLVDKTSAAGETPEYDYTTRGQEYWYTFFVVDNQILKDYLVTLDGYGVIEVWFYDETDGAYVAKGQGTYTITDTVVNYSWSYTSDTEGAGTVYTAEGEIDGYSGYYAIIYVNHSEFESRLVDSTDFSVLVMDGYGYATRYLTDGYIEYGYYTVLDESYLYYESVSGETGMVIRYSFEKGTMLPAKYSGGDAIYYTNDLTGSVYLTSTGLLTFDSENYYCYVMEGNSIYVYYIPDDASTVEGYGYAKSNAISVSGGKITLGGKTYTQVSIGDTLGFDRDASDGDKYGYLASGSSGSEIQYGLGTIRFTNEGDEFAATGTITLTLNGASTTGTVYVYREYDEGTSGYVMYMAMYSDIFGSYYD